MSNDGDPLDVLRRLAGDPEAPPSQEREAFARLQDVMGRAPDRVRGRLPVRRPRLAAAFLVGLTVLVLAITTFLGPSQAQAALGEIARASREAAAVDIPDGYFVHQELFAIDLTVRPGSELGLDQSQVAYLVRSHRELWWQPGGDFFESRTTAEKAEFFSAATEQSYRNHKGEALDQIGQTVVEQFTGVNDPIRDTAWPTSSDELRSVMEQHLAQGHDTRPLEVQIFDLGADILQSTVDPRVRAALIDVLAGLDVELVDTGDDGSVSVAMRYLAPPEARTTLTIAADGTLLSASTTWLAAEPTLGIPKDTTVSSEIYVVMEIVDHIPGT